jgi:hypothetical protein
MAKKQLKASGQYSSELWDMLEKQVTTQLDKIDTDKLGVMMFKKLDANGDGKVPSLFCLPSISVSVLFFFSRIQPLSSPLPLYHFDCIPGDQGGVQFGGHAKPRPIGARIHGQLWTISVKLSP